MSHRPGEHESGPGHRGHLCAPRQHTGPPHMALRGGHLYRHQQEQGAHDFTGQFTTTWLDYFSLGEFMFLAETQFASLRPSTTGFWFCFQKQHRTMLLHTGCCSEIFKWNIMSPHPPPFPFPGLKSSPSFNRFYCDTFQMSSEFSFLLEFRPEMLDLLRNS